MVLQQDTGGTLTDRHIDYYTAMAAQLRQELRTTPSGSTRILLRRKYTAAERVVDVLLTLNWHLKGQER